MSRADDLQDCEDCLAPADAFAIVGEETRLSILEALWRLDEPAAFSEIRAEVGMTDSAQFNYHLGKLTDQFVRKTDDGYELRTAGERIVQAIFAGSFTQHPEREIEIDDPCVRCGATLSANYVDEQLSITCPSCGHGHGEYPFPPGGLHDRTDAEILSAFDQRVRHLHCLAKDGVCPECNGRMATTIGRGEDCCLGVSVRATHRCRQCAHELCSAVGLGLLDQSPVVSFYEDHGVDLAQTPYWRLDWCVDDHPVTVVDDDPWRLRVDVTRDGDRLAVVVDGALEIVETRRDPATPAE
ncbi:helix-turn-helix domain-containing protein [Halomicrobium mukohataei]|uniref:Helix-turn-helix domain-containing protein n=1 Tax=Halomicrobium mukohataei TaxID=57705 RepID=A0A847UB57_9EURY|nr:winged helix-turn-helix domain-containing protein [Halomicrobium mukohataei]NLV08700.1 helix-turn-helix domain-containing protein [Halomicrobium mukohataei]